VVGMFNVFLDEFFQSTKKLCFLWFKISRKSDFKKSIDFIFLTSSQNYKKVFNFLDFIFLIIQFNLIILLMIATLVTSHKKIKNINKFAGVV
jgi:cellulose synthase/poly-beta-1,6-N-acetylglucosamine synthase-like glycosyltransferase